MKPSAPTMELEKIGKQRKRKVINNAKTNDWKEQVKEYEQSKSNVGNTTR